MYPMPISLSDAKVRNAKPKAKPYKIADGEGLFLLITPSGGKYWRLKYFFAGKEKLLALGVYPDVALADARERRAQARKVLAAGRDPGEAKKEAKRVAMLESANAFEVVAREWFEKRKTRVGIKYRRYRSSTASNSTSFRSWAKGQLAASPRRKFLPCFA